MTSAKFLDCLTPSPLSAFGTDLYSKIHATSLLHPLFHKPLPVECGRHMWTLPKSRSIIIILGNMTPTTLSSSFQVSNSIGTLRHHSHLRHSRGWVKSAKYFRVSRSLWAARKRRVWRRRFEAPAATRALWRQGRGSGLDFGRPVESHGYQKEVFL